jgi:hypothetical protein
MKGAEDENIKNDAMDFHYTFVLMSKCLRTI